MPNNSQTHQEEAQADGILRYMLEKGRASSKQVGWLIGYIRRLRGKARRPQDNAESS